MRCRSVGIFRLRTKGQEVCLFVCYFGSCNEYVNLSRVYGPVSVSEFRQSWLTRKEDLFEKDGRGGSHQKFLCKNWVKSRRTLVTISGDIWRAYFHNAQMPFIFSFEMLSWWWTYWSLCLCYVDFGFEEKTGKNDKWNNIFDEECRHLEYGAVYVLWEPTFHRNVSLPSERQKELRRRYHHDSGWRATWLMKGGVGGGVV
jgi:hypothetical protein